MIRNYVPDEIDRELLARLAGLAAQRDAIEESIRLSVLSLREIDIPWRVIGETIGTTRSAAQQRYGA